MGSPASCTSSCSGAFGVEFPKFSLTVVLRDPGVDGIVGGGGLTTVGSLATVVLGTGGIWVVITGVGKWTFVDI